ncbi:Mediator of RNA polymerase II transcription subunit 31, partial [Cucurbita argyrosperma subsp. sororia]
MASNHELNEEADDNPSSPTNVYKDPDDGRQRFLLELEFVQCLANPTYIHYLAQNRYLEDEAFIGYLKYLQYWQQPEYIKYIMYPHCLFFLELLQNANFRNAMAHPANKELTHRQQFYFWKNYRNNRLKHILPRPLLEPAAQPPPVSGPPQAAVSAPAPAMAASPAERYEECRNRSTKEKTRKKYAVVGGCLIAAHEVIFHKLKTFQELPITWDHAYMSKDHSFWLNSNFIREGQNQSQNQSQNKRPLNIKGRPKELRNLKDMASIAISASFPRSCTSNHVSNKQQHARQTRPTYSSMMKNPTPELIKTPNVGDRDAFDAPKRHGNVASATDKLEEDTDDMNHGQTFTDERWKNGTWDLNMFVKNGKMDWEGVIVAGRAAMIGFFMAYLVDALTGIGIVGQSGNFISKSALFVTVIGVLVFRQTQDIEGLRKLAEEATFYDKQWQASWQNQNENST